MLTVASRFTAGEWRRADDVLMHGDIVEVGGSPARARASGVFDQAGTPDRQTFPSPLAFDFSAIRENEVTSMADQSGW